MSKIEGVAKKFDGTAIDYVSIFNWSDGQCIAQIKPDAVGQWEFVHYSNLNVGITYVADGCEPITHGAYQFIGSVPDGYILSYKFNGNMIDDSSNNLNGVKVGNASFEVGRKLGTQCIRFTAGAVKTPTSIPLNSPELTISYWLKVYAGGGYIFEMSENHNDKLNAFGSPLSADGKTQEFAVTNTNSANSHYEKADLKGLGVWQHVVITVNRALPFADEIKIYVDKELVSTTGGFPENNKNLTGNFLPYVLSIGSRWGTSLFSNCAIQDFRVYDRVLTSEEISGLYEE